MIKFRQSEAITSHNESFWSIVHSFFREIYEDLLQNGVMKPLASKIEGLKSSEVTDYVVPNGMSSLVKHFFKKSGVSPIFQKNVNNIKIVDNDKIAVSTSVSLYHNSHSEKKNQRFTFM